MARPRRDHRDCPYEAAAQAMKCIGGRWKILIVRYLLDRDAAGFNELQRVLPGVSPKMLTQQLRELATDGVVLRHELVSDPPKTVRYRLTPLGRDLAPVSAALSVWGQAWLERYGTSAQIAKPADEAATAQ
ncbi:MAG: helix-turn-helix domain-containing protein [Pseudomonadota bacterium]